MIRRAGEGVASERPISRYSGCTRQRASARPIPTPHMRKLSTGRLAAAQVSNGCGPLFGPHADGLGCGHSGAAQETPNPLWNKDLFGPLQRSVGLVCSRCLYGWMPWASRRLLLWADGPHSPKQLSYHTRCVPSGFPVISHTLVASCIWFRRSIVSCMSSLKIPQDIKKPSFWT